MSWAQVILSLIQLAAALVAWRRRENALEQAQDQLIAENATKLAELTAWGEAQAERLRALSDQALDVEIDQLRAPPAPPAGAQS